jgi:hypothetical protein
MTKRIQIVCFCSLVTIITTVLLIGSALAAQTVPLPDKPAASYHPGLFTQCHAETATATIPPVVNTYEGTNNDFTYTPPSVSYSFFPGNKEKGELASVAGYVSGTMLNVCVNISGRTDKTGHYQYLATIAPDNRGIFVWPVPDQALNLTEFLVEIRQ